MIFKCKHCGTPITKSVANGSMEKEPMADDDLWADFYVPDGVFTYIPDSHYMRDEILAYTSPRDMINVVIECFEQGKGCCNVSNGYVRCVTCNTNIATAALDCWQDKRIELLKEHCDGPL